MMTSTIHETTGTVTVAQPSCSHWSVVDASARGGPVRPIGGQMLLVGGAVIKALPPRLPVVNEPKVRLAKLSSCFLAIACYWPG